MDTLFNYPEIKAKLAEIPEYDTEFMSDEQKEILKTLESYKS